MKQFWLSVLATLIGAAIVGNFAFMFSANARLARVEASTQRLEMLAEKNQLLSRK